MAVNQKINCGVYERTNNGRFNLPRNGQCFLCLSRLEMGESLLCPACSNDLPRNNKACTSCAAPIVYGAICANCMQSPGRNIQNTFCAFRYEYPASLMIRHMKFHSRLDIVAFFGGQLANYVSQQMRRLPDCIIPVPLHSSRTMGRGFNQSLALARVIAGINGVPVDYKACARIQNTTAQTGLSAQQRRRNIKGAFAIDGGLFPEYKHVTIIDDVVTTGSTVNELARVLSLAGIEKIDVWACARASVN